MKVIFPNHPLKSRLPDPDYESEFNAARDAGFQCEVYSLERLRSGDVDETLLHCAPADSPNEAILHRGWMMSDLLYAEFFKGLCDKGYLPITTPDAYAQAHYLPNAYALLEGRTAISKWIEGRDADRAWDLYSQMGKQAAIVKDFVKSAKHRWHEACFIPEETERGQFNEIIKAFLDARGNLFEKGIVLRRFHRFVKLQDDLRGQPVNEEYRLFMWDAKLLAATPSLRGAGPLESLDEWQSIAKRFQNRFISIDVARQEDNSWLIVEVGDGGVSGLPDSIDAKYFYEALFEKTNSHTTSDTHAS